MTTKYTVSELLCGMRNIDRMRSEIDDMLGGLSGRLVRLREIQRMPQMTTEVMVFENDTIRWRIQVFICNEQTNIHCFPVFGRTVGAQIYGSSGKVKTVIAMEHAQLVHEGLQVLVDGLITRFPELVSSAEIARRAAQVKFAD